jgi:hypothetical protein
VAGSFGFVLQQSKPSRTATGRQVASIEEELKYSIISIHKSFKLCPYIIKSIRSWENAGLTEYKLRQNVFRDLARFTRCNVMLTAEMPTSNEAHTAQATAKLFSLKEAL